MRTAFEHALRLFQSRAGGAGVREREMGACELEPDLDRQPRESVVEQRPQAVCARERARASSVLASWSATRAVATWTMALVV